MLLLRKIVGGIDYFLNETNRDMETVDFVFEIVIGIVSAIGLLFCGIFIGRKYGTLENFILKILEKFKNDYSDTNNQMNECKHCEFLYQIFGEIEKLNPREYWLFTEIFSYLHDGDECKKTNKNEKPIYKTRTRDNRLTCENS